MSRFDHKGPLPEPGDPSHRGDTVAAELPPQDQPNGALWLYYLFLRPTTFFRHFVVEPVPLLTALAAWLLGISSVMDHLAPADLQDQIGDQASPFAELVSSWRTYWVLCLTLGAISGVLYFAIGGWWYRVRLEFSGAQQPDRALARRVYLFASQVCAIPAVLYVTWETNHYGSPAEAAEGENALAVVVVVFLFWSVYTSYRGVRTAFQVRQWTARLWFLILPAGFYGLLMAGLCGAFLLQEGIFDLEPRVDHPVVIQEPGFQLSYPSNWDLSAGGENCASAYCFIMMPFTGDAYVTIAIHDSPDDPEALLEDTLATLPSGATVSSSPIRRWGRYDGHGLDLILDRDGDTYRCLIFAATTEHRAFQVREMSHQEVDDVLGPGFELIRRSFRLADP